jgi:AcrR family transcriptional regulator
MARTYTLKRRAEQQADTRRRIVEAAVALHGSVGPASTTLTMVAEKAGVQRHTLYAHFPTERALLMACSAQSLEESPLPDAQGWRAIPDRSKRLKTGLSEIYRWYADNAALAACVMRDAEHHALTREIAGLRYGPYVEAYRQVLGTGLSAKQRAMLNLALSFFTWRSLVRDSGLGQAAAIAAMVQAIEGA